MFNKIGLACGFYWRDFNLKGDVGIVLFITMKKHIGLPMGYGARDLFCLLWFFSNSESITFYKKKCLGKVYFQITKVNSLIRFLHLILFYFSPY